MLPFIKTDYKDFIQLSWNTLRLIPQAFLPGKTPEILQASLFPQQAFQKKNSTGNPIGKCLVIPLAIFPGFVFNSHSG